LTLLPACADRVVYKTDVVFVSVPANFYQRTESPGFSEIKTWRDAAVRLYDFDAALEKCNADKSAIGDFVRAKESGGWAAK
jgi:hypothetical protein